MPAQRPHHPLRFLRGLATAAVIATATAGLSGCRSRLSGTYESANGVMTVEFHSGKAYLTMPLATVEVPYEVDGNKVILQHVAGVNVVLTRNADGSLQGPMGKLTKK